MAALVVHFPERLDRLAQLANVASGPKRAVLFGNLGLVIRAGGAESSRARV